MDYPFVHKLKINNFEYNRMSYSPLCYHDKLERIDDTYVRCIICGESMVNQQYLQKNKRMEDFPDELFKATRSFDNKFSNIVSNEYNNPPGKSPSDHKSMLHNNQIKSGYTYPFNGLNVPVRSVQNQDNNSYHRYYYYTDKYGKNKVKIDLVPPINQAPVRYNVQFNDKNLFITKDKINELLSKIDAIKIDQNVFNTIPDRSSIIFEQPDIQQKYKQENINSIQQYQYDNMYAPVGQYQHELMR